jgi:hypothetical protein
MGFPPDSLHGHDKTRPSTTFYEFIFSSMQKKMNPFVFFVIFVVVALALRPTGAFRIAAHGKTILSR